MWEKGVKIGVGEKKVVERSEWGVDGSNLKFLSKLVEKSVFVLLNNYLTINGLHERFQSAYKTHHSTETALLTITNDILLSLDRGDNIFLSIVTKLNSSI